MVTILETSRNFNEAEKYLMTISPAIISMKNVEDGTKIPVDGFLSFEDMKDDGEVTEITSIITPDKEVYSFQSKTFRRSLEDISKIMGDKSFTIVKMSGKTKKDRNFITCCLDIHSL